MKDKLNLFVVDDHQLFREGLTLLLSTRAFVGDIHAVASGMAFLDSPDFALCDLVLMDIEMPEMNGIETTREAIQRRPELKVIALSMYGEMHYYEEMTAAGASGFVLKNSGIDSVVEAIQTVAAGDVFFSEELLRQPVDNQPAESLSSDEEASRIILSDREREVLQQVCRGLSNNEIADNLFISKRTVDKHRANLLLKTGCRNTAALIVFAIRNKWISL